ncbi:MAG: carboxypeptidase regulatory-like domain-containing protein [Acidobacteriia bacterium]|nr:carboxypeptidase regulatory-like domain-containing protein [Terriglobia bacterium]
MSRMSETLRTIFCGVTALLLLIAGSTCPAFAQTESTGGAIQGTVVDPSGGVVPGAQVTARNLATGLTRSMTTDTTGYYRIPALPVGEYEVTVEATGFNTSKSSSVKLTVGQVLTVNFTAAVAGQKQTITVTGQAPVVETTRSSVSNTIGDVSIADLPVNGRNFIDFVLLTPGVTRDNRLGDISFAGQRGTLNSLQIDGTDNNNTFFGQTLGRTGSGRAPYQFSEDSVKEFQVNSNSYSAEFGRAGGAVINVVTKSGTNAFHGTVFEFYRDKSLNANDFFNNSLNRPKSPFHFNQFGGNIGGPIVKNKAFFFFDYDGQRNTQPNVVFLGGKQPFPSDPATQQALAILTPLADSWNRTQNQDVFLWKIDWQLSQNNHLTGRFNHQKFNGEGFENGGAQNSSQHTGASNVFTDTVSASLTSVLWKDTVNEVRFQFARDKEPGLANSANPEAVINQGGQNVLTIGRNSFSPRETTIKRVQFVDNVAHTFGKHNLKAGFDVNIDRILNFFPGNFSGSYTFNSLASFAGGVPNGPGEQYVQAFPGSGTSGPSTFPDFWELGWFIQDEFHATPSLTLNFGLRYDIQNFNQPPTQNPDPQLAAAGIDTSFLNTDKNNFGPRFGFAWKLGGSDKLVVRGGYGIFYGRTPSIMVGTAHSNNGINVQTLTFRGAGVPTYPNILPGIPTGVTLPSPTIYAFSKDYVQPYVQQGSFGFEYQIMKDTSITVSYLGVRGAKLQRTLDRNLAPPVLRTLPTSDGTQVAFPFYSSPRPLSHFLRIETFESDANSIYHGMTVSLNKRFSRNYQLLVSYTLSKVIDDVPDATSVVPFSSGDDGKQIQSTFDIRSDRALGINDQRHRFVVSTVWDLNNYAKGLTNPFVRALASGWSLSGILTAQSGQPFTGKVGGGDLNGDSNQQTDRFPGLGRDTFTLPNFVSVDPRVTREIPIHERARLQLIFEGFNIFNRTNFNTVRTTQWSLQTIAAQQVLVRQSNFGTPLSTAGPRILQLAAKITF